MNIDRMIAPFCEMVGQNWTQKQSIIDLVKKQFPKEKYDTDNIQVIRDEKQNNYLFKINERT